MVVVKVSQVQRVVCGSQTGADVSIVVRRKDQLRNVVLERWRSDPSARVLKLSQEFKCRHSTICEILHEAGEDTMRHVPPMNLKIIDVWIENPHMNLRDIEVMLNIPYNTVWHTVKRYLKSIAVAQTTNKNARKIEDGKN